MNEPSVEHDAEHLSALLRERASGIAPGGDPAALVDGVLAGATDSFFGVESPLGMVYVAAGPEGIRYLAPAASEEEFARRYRERFGRFVVPAARDRVEGLGEKVAAALAGERTVVPLDLSRTTPFQRRGLGAGRGITPRGGRPHRRGGRRG